MSRLARGKVAAIVAAVLMEKDWIHPWLEDYTFFSDYDLWRYRLIMDKKVCIQCLHHNDSLYSGLIIRTLFPELWIRSKDRIEARVHPNCRCELIRTG